MPQEYLTKKQIEKRISCLNDWINKNPTDPMIGTVKKESSLYMFQLEELVVLNIKRIQNKVPTQIYHQIGVLL